MSISLISTRFIISSYLVALVVMLLAGCGNREQGLKIKPEKKQEVSEETSRFHQIVEHGSLEELQQQLKRNVAINAPGSNGKNALMIVIAAKDLAKMKLLIEQGADPELTDDFNATALRHAVYSNFTEGVRYLLKQGVERGYHPRYPLKKLEIDRSVFDTDALKMPDGLKGMMNEEEWKEHLKQTSDILAEMDYDLNVEPIIKDVYNVEILNLFVEAGDNMSQVSKEFKRVLVGLDKEEEIDAEKKIVFQASLKEYQKSRSPRYGTRNPDRINDPFWNDMIRLGCSAYRARDHFKDTDSFNGSGPVWCYDRFGSSLTQLKDGRFVQIGGEHEDFYDSDFYIYNDVVLFDGKGNFQFFGYPKEVFPPTDFHSATLVNDSIYIIGCLGYPEQRTAKQTPVFRLKIDTWEMEAVKTTGDSPGWLFEHRAIYEHAKNVILIEGGKIEVIDGEGEPEHIENQKKFELDLSSFQWRKQN